MSVLSPSQQRVLGLLAAGYTNAAIAEALGRTVPGVEGAVRDIYLRLGLVDERRDKRVCAALWFHRSSLTLPRQPTLGGRSG